MADQRVLFFGDSHVAGVGDPSGVGWVGRMLTEAQKVATRHGWQNVSLVCKDAAKLTLDEPVDAVHFSLSYSVLPERAPVLRGCRIVDASAQID